MTMWLVGGLGGLLRLGVGAVGLVYAFTVALGSGADDFVSLLGFKLSTPHQVLLATLVFGAAVLWDNTSLRRMITGHANTPLITWAYPKAELRANGSMLIQVECENTGPIDSVAILREGRAWTGTGPLEMPVQEWSPILSSKIDQLKHRFTVAIYSQANTQHSPGEWRIDWTLVYADNNRPDTHLYLTQATVVVGFDNVGPGVIKQQFMDGSSKREERHKRYLDEMKRRMKAEKAAAKQAAR